MKLPRGMILLLPGNAKAVLKHITVDSGHYGWLLTPRRTMTRTGLYELCYAVDNECYTLGDKFDPGVYVRALKRIRDQHGRGGCLFATCPDVVADAPATLAKFDGWARIVHGIGLPVALVGQDGLEYLPVPWDRFECLFIGGGTEWKLGEGAAGLMWEARRRGKWVHVGRVNSWTRVDELRVKPDSIDGTHWAKRPDKYMREWERELRARRHQGAFPFLERVKQWAPGDT